MNIFGDCATFFVLLARTTSSSRKHLVTRFWLSSTCSLRMTAVWCAPDALTHSTRKRDSISCGPWLLVGELLVYRYCSCLQVKCKFPGGGFIFFFPALFGAFRISTNSNHCCSTPNVEVYEDFR